MAPKGNKKPAAKKSNNQGAKPAAKPAPKKSAPKPAAKKSTGGKKAGAVKLGVYIKGLSFPDLSKETVAETFAKCGKVTEVRLRHGKYTLVFFDNEAGVKKARELSGKVVKGQKITVDEVKKAKPTRPRAEYCTTVYVGGLPGGSTKKQLVQHFGGCGKISKVRIYKAGHHGFVYFENNAAAKKAVAMADTLFSHGKDVSAMETVPAQLQRKLEIKFSIRTRKGDAKANEKKYNRRAPSQIEAAEAKSATRAEMRAAAKAAKASGSGSGSKGSKTRKGSRKGSSKKSASKK